MLIKRVTQTLQEIRAKKKPAGQQESDLETTSDSTDRPPGVFDRPKTRRREEPLESPERFRTSPVEAAPELSDEEAGEFELLQAKLNTIIEHSEPEESVKSEATRRRRSDPMGVLLTTNCVNTDVPQVSDQPTQTHSPPQPPEFYQFENIHTQTDILAVTSTCDKEQQFEELHSTRRTLVKSENLSIQLLPEVSIPGKLQVERPLSLYIDEDGDTHVLRKSEKPNVGYFEFRDPDAAKLPRMSVTPTLLKVRGAIIEEKAAEEATCSQASPITSIFLSALGQADQGSNWTLRSFPGETIWKGDERKREPSENNIELKQVPRRAERKPRLSVIRSYSDTQLNLESVVYSRHEVLKSYQVLTGLDDHDPGDLSVAASNVLMSTIDPKFFQTYINPEGVEVLKSQASVSLVQQKNKGSSAAASKAKQDKSCGPTGKIHSESVYGLFASKGIQCDISGESSSTDDRYEKISFSISYSTSSSDEQQQQQQQRLYRRKEDPASHPPMYHHRRSTLNQDSIKKLRSIREKLAKEHPETTEETSDHARLSFRHTPIIQQHSRDDDDELKDKDDEEKDEDEKEDRKRAEEATKQAEPVVKDFICGLMSYESAELQRVVPLIRTMVRSSASSKRAERKETVERESITDTIIETSPSDDEKDKKFTVNFLAPLYNHMGDVVMSPLRVGRNGRYADEKNLFCCRNDTTKADSDTLRNDKINFNPRSKGIVDSSFSSTITSTEKSLSEGEVTCKGSSISNGEVHPPCTRTFSGTFQKTCKNGRIQKKRTYFSNLVTYYINKDGFALNDSTSSSNK